MERITSRQNPLITRLRRLGAEKKTRRAQGVFLCEGTCRFPLSLCSLFKSSQSQRVWSG